MAGCLGPQAEWSSPNPHRPRCQHLGWCGCPRLHFCSFCGPLATNQAADHSFLPQPPRPPPLPSSLRREAEPRSRIQESEPLALLFRISCCGWQALGAPGTRELLWGCSPSGGEQETETKREKELTSSCTLDAEDPIRVGACLALVPGCGFCYVTGLAEG